MEREYVGIDFHRRRSVVVQVGASGERLSVARIDNTPAKLAAAVTAAGDRPEVVIEATYGWYWAVDVLQELGASVHLANPNGLNWGERRVKNDIVDACDLADMLRMGRLPEAWIAPPAVRELRELVRYRAKLVQLRSGLKAQVHAVMAKEGVLPTVVDMFGPAGQVQLDEMGLAESYTIRVESLRDLIEIYDREIVMLEREIHHRLRHDRGYQAVQAINGVGRTIAAIIVVEVGDVTRFPTPAPSVFVGRAHPGSPRVGPQGSRHRDHQARLEAVAVGVDRRHLALPRRPTAGRRVPSHRRAAWSHQGAGGDRSPSAHARLLRHARRRDPLPHPTGGGMTGSDTTTMASSCNGMTRATAAESAN